MATYVDLDVAADVTVGGVLFLTDSEGVVVARTVTAIEGRRYWLSGPIANAPIPGSVWGMENPSVQHQLYRIIGVADNNDNTYTMTGVKHEPGKFDYIENNLQIQPRSISILVPDVQPPPTNLRIGSYGRASNTGTNAVVVAQWDEAIDAQYYEISWRKDNGVWGPALKIHGSVCEYENAFTGIYEYRIVAVNKNKTSPPAFSPELAVGEVPLQPINETLQTLTPDGGIVTIDCSVFKNFKLTLDQNVAVVFTNVPQTKDVFLQVLQTGSFAITWPASVETSYTGPTTGSTDLVSLKTISYGASWQLTANPVSVGGTMNVIIDPNYIEFEGDGSPNGLNVTTIGNTGAVTYSWVRTDTNGGTNFTFSSLSAEDPNVSVVLPFDVAARIQTWKVTATDAAMNVAEATVTLTAVNSTYVEDDPMCIAADSWMYEGNRAYQVAVQDLIGAWDRNVAEPGVTAVRVQGNSPGRARVYRLTTESGKTVRQSESTPMDLPDGRIVLTPAMLGESVLICDRDTDAMWWETVVRVEYIGVGTVVKLSAGDSMLFAGDSERYMIATHNIRMKP